MKKSSSLFVLLFLLILPFTKLYAVDNSITTFWVNSATLTNLANSGAITFKVYAATDATGSNCYILVGCDAAYTPISAQAYMQNSKGVCPPSCEFSSIDISATTVGIVSAQGMVSSYMATHLNAKNCARFTLASLSAMRSNSDVIKIALGTASASGYKVDGTPSGKTSVTGTAIASVL